MAQESASLGWADKVHQRRMQVCEWMEARPSFNKQHLRSVARCRAGLGGAHHLL